MMVNAWQQVGNHIARKGRGEVEGYGELWRACNVECLQYGAVSVLHVFSQLVPSMASMTAPKCLDRWWENSYNKLDDEYVSARL